MPGSGSDHGHKKRRPSFWGCKPSGPRSTGKSREPTEFSVSQGQTSDHPASRTNSPSSLRPDISTTSQRYHSGRKKKVGIDTDPQGGFWSSSIRLRTMAYDDFSPRSPRFIMRPFSQLVSRVKHCPWMLGSDVHPLTPSSAADDVFFPPVPRSLLHDTAVSFVITDHTRVEQPQFVISCPLENVELVQRLLAPEGSHRQLSARGSSRQPRNADQLRSMLLDGTPNIELSLHWAPDSGYPSVGRHGPGGGHPLGPGGGFEFQGNFFAHPYKSYRDGPAGRQGRPSEAGGNGGADSPGGGGSGTNEHRQSGWDAYGTSPMNEPVGETAGLPTGHLNSPSLTSTQRVVQQESDQRKASEVDQMQTATHQPDSPSLVTDQPVAQTQSHKEGIPRGSTTTPDSNDNPGVSSRSSRQATVESAGSSPRMTPIGPEEHQPMTPAEVVITPLVLPIGTPVDQSTTPPAVVDSILWRTPRETLEELQSASAEGEGCLDFRTFPVLQVVTPPNVDQQEPYGGGPIPGMGRWWWPGNPLSSSHPS